MAEVPTPTQDPRLQALAEGVSQSLTREGSGGIKGLWERIKWKGSESLVDGLKSTPVFGKPLSEFALGMAAGFGMSGLARAGLMLAGFEGVGLAVAAGATVGTVKAGGGEWLRQARNNWSKLREERAAAEGVEVSHVRLKLKERLKGLKPTDAKKLALATSRGAVFGALGGLVGGKLAEEFGGLIGEKVSEFAKNLPKPELPTFSVSPPVESSTQGVDQTLTYATHPLGTSEELVATQTAPPGKAYSLEQSEAAVQSTAPTQEVITPSVDRTLTDATHPLGAPEEILSGQVAAPAPIQAEVAPTSPPGAETTYTPPAPDQNLTDTTHPLGTSEQILAGQATSQAPPPPAVELETTPQAPVSPDQTLTDTTHPAGVSSELMAGQADTSTIPPAEGVAPTEQGAAEAGEPPAPTEEVTGAEVVQPDEMTTGESATEPEAMGEGEPSLPPELNDNLQKLGDQQVLEAGNNPWSLSQKILTEFGIEPTNQNIYKLDYALMQANGIGVPEWNLPANPELTGGRVLDARAIPAGLNLKIDDNVRQVLINLANK